MNTIKQLPPELIENIYKMNCALFLGTRTLFSENEKPTEEFQLAIELSRYCHYDAPNKILAKVAEDFEMSLGRQSLVERFSGWIETQREQPSRLDRAVAVLPINTIITTRTDLMLEEAFRQAGKEFIRVVLDNEISFSCCR